MNFIGRKSRPRKKKKKILVLLNKIIKIIFSINSFFFLKNKFKSTWQFSIFNFMNHKVSKGVSPKWESGRVWIRKSEVNWRLCIYFWNKGHFHSATQFWPVTTEMVWSLFLPSIIIVRTTCLEGKITWKSIIIIFLSYLWKN